jgi:hypothetical protein
LVNEEPRIIRVNETRKGPANQSSVVVTEEVGPLSVDALKSAIETDEADWNGHDVKRNVRHLRVRNAR